MKRPVRTRFAALAACVIAFAQIAVAAQPFPIDAFAPHRHAPAPVPAQSSDAADTAAPCTGHLANGDGGTIPAGAPSPNFCEVHCQDAAQPDAMVVAIAAPVADAWLLVTIADVVFERAPATGPLDAKCASPPARVLFSRFLN